MSRPQSETAHIHQLKQRITQLEATTHSGIAYLVDGFPELADLCHVISDLIFRAEPLSGAVWDESRGNPDPLSSDGKSTAAGRSTYNARRRLEYWRRRTAGMVEAMKNDLDPAMKPADARPRCGRRGCDGRGRRQPVGVKFCGFCGEAMKRTKRDRVDTTPPPQPG